MITAQCIHSRKQGIIYENALLKEPPIEIASEAVDIAKRRGILEIIGTLLFLPALAKRSESGSVT